MDGVVYERPREKLQYRGAGHLTDSELLQAIVGSGSEGVSSAKLAREIARLVKRRVVAYESLREIKGVGHAKACQVLAAIEIGRRYERVSLKGAKSELAKRILDECHAQATLNRDKRITCYWFDGSGHQIDYKKYQIQKSEHVTLTVRRIAGDALHASAHSIIVFLPAFTSDYTPRLEDRSFMQYMQDAVQYLHISLQEVCGFTEKGYRRWKDEVL